MSNYRRGADFERTVQDDLEDKGYLVIRAAGSHGIMDLVAFTLRERFAPPLFIQCKTNGKMSPKERRDLWEVAHICGAVPIKASRPKRGAILFERWYRGSKKFGEIEL